MCWLHFAFWGGTSLIAGCLSIYFGGGDSPYSRESILRAFLAIALPFGLCALGVLGGIGISLFLPCGAVFSTEGGTDIAAAEVGRNRLFARTDISLCPAKTRAALAAEGKRRRLVRAAATVISVLAAIPPLVYLLNPANFPNADLNREVLSALTLLLPCAAVAGAACSAAAMLNRASFVRESALLREAIAAGATLKKGAQGTKMSEKTEGVARFSRLRDFVTLHKTVLLCALRGGVAAVGIAFVILGIGNGGMTDVLEKAVRICTECIGLG